MKIIITMAGRGSRFKKVGINKPKHEIIVRNKTLFEWSMLSLINFFDEEFIFLVQNDGYDKEELSRLCRILGINKFKFVEIFDLTDGQGRTVMYAAPFMKDSDDFLVYNIDTHIKNEKLNKSVMKGNDGHIAIFKAEGSQWSFVQLDNNKKYVINVSEKERISDLATVGAYYFASWGKYVEIIESFGEEIILDFNELYIAPMYNYLIGNKNKVSYSLLEENDLMTMGTPSEIEVHDSDYIINNL